MGAAKTVRRPPRGVRGARRRQNRQRTATRTGTAADNPTDTDAVCPDGAVLTSGALTRLLWASGVVALMWLAVWWALA
jgi:hypothetical protein